MKKLDKKKRTIPEAYFDAGLAGVMLVGGIFASVFIWRIANKAYDRLMENENGQ